MAFSILLLHTDAHNKNVKRKMNRDTFIMRTRLIEGGENIPPEILDVGCSLFTQRNECSIIDMYGLDYL
jgi:hypothetical protein